MRPFSLFLLSITLSVSAISGTYALSYPVTTPTGEVVGGTYRTYFDNIFANAGDDCDVLGQVIGGFTSTGVPICVTPVSSGLFLLGQTSGDTIRYDGTAWIRNNLLYNNGTDIGIGTTTPGAKLDVNGQIKITGGGYGSGKILTSDANGLAFWADQAASSSASGVTGGTQHYIPKFGTGGVGLLLSQIFDDGSSIGIGTTTPSSSVKVDILGDLLVNTLRLGRGGGNLLSNSVFGWSALALNATATNTLALGYSALSSLTLGDGNVALGSLAGSSLTSGSNNIFLGYNAQPNISPTASNQLNIGNWIYGNGGNIGIGVSNPSAKLDINGQIKIGGGSPGLGKYLISDASGLASWTGNVIATALSLVGSSLGSTLYYDGTNWTPSTNIYNTGGNVGIGTSTPGAKLDVNGQVRIAGGSPGTGYILVSDATGLASWQPAVPASSVDAANITGGVENYIPRFGTGGTGIFPSHFYQTGSYIGLRTTSPTTELDINGRIRMRSGAGTGLYLISDANGLASWTGMVVATSFSISGQALGTTPYYDGSSWVASANIYNTGGNVGIGTSTPGAKLDLNGQIKIGGGSPGSGKVLTSDANGLAVWASVFSGSTLATNITGGASGYLSLFGSSGSGLFSSLLFQTGSFIGINTITPAYTLDISGTGNMLGLRLPTGAATGYILVSDTSGNARWAPGFSGTVSSSGVTGGSGFYIPYFGTGGAGLYSSFLYYTGARLGINTVSPQYMVDLRGSGSILNAGSGLCIDQVCINAWSGLNNLVRSMGTPNYIAKFDSGGLINNSQIYETGGKLYIGDIPGILSGAATIGYITIEAAGSTNSSNPFLTLSENGGQECRMWITGANKLGSNCTWSAGTSGFGLQANQVPKADSTGDALTGSVMYINGQNVGIGLTNPSTNLHVSGSTLITGDLTLNGKLITDTIVTRTVTNLSISGSLVPQSVTPLTYRDIGTNTGRWNNLYLSGQITLGGGSPGSGKVLMSDANGLAFWSSTISGATASGITGGIQNYVPKFGTGGNGLYPSQIFDNGSNIGVGTGSNLITKFTIDSGINDDSGFRLARINPNSPLTSNGVVALGVNGSGKVIPISPISNIAVYTGVLRTSVLTPNPDLNTFNVTYDFNRYFAIPGKQSFVVSKGDGPSYNGPYFKENGTDALCSITGLYGSPGAYDCANVDPATGISASPYNSFTMTAKGDTFGYQLALGARGDAPLFARSGRFNGSQTGGLYTNDSPYQTPAPWQRVLSVPANHPEYFYINTGLNSQLQYSSGGGRVAIGTTTPTSRFEVWSGSTSVSMLHFRGTDNVGMGLSALDVASTGQRNSAFGAYSLDALISGGGNVGIGFRAGVNITSGSNNIMIGSGASANSTVGSNQLNIGNWIYGTGGYIAIGNATPRSRFEVWDRSSALLHFRGDNNTGFGSGAVRTGLTGNANSGFGAESLYTLTSGYSNSAFGFMSLRMTTGGFNNSAFGQEALYNNGFGNYNAALGYQTLYSNTSGVGNVGIGSQALFNVTTGDNNIGIGYQALYSSTASDTIGIGFQSLYSSTTGTGNVALGANSLDTVSTGYGNTGLGYNTLTNATGNNNIAIGANTADALTSGSNNIAIGASVDLASNTASNQLNIGNWIYGTGGNIGIGTSSPGAKLDVNGTVKLGASGTTIKGAGVCSSSVIVVSTGATAMTSCTGLPSSTDIAVTCSPNGSFSATGTTISCRATGTGGVLCNTSANNTSSRTYKCMWMQ